MNVQSGAPRPRSQQDSPARILQSFFSIAFLMATLFTAFPLRSLSINLREGLASLTNAQLEPDPAIQPAPTGQAALQIGVVAGHWGNDSGAVCANGTREVDVNQTIAILVVQKLTALGYQVDLMQEFDPRLDGYQAVVLVSIHNDSCDYINDIATGFKVAASQASVDPARATRLTACLIDRYSGRTNLPFHEGSITIDMTDYHAFREISPSTTAAIIETGFLYLDYDILTMQPGLISDGIVDGILCYLQSESVSATALPGTTP